MTISDDVKEKIEDAIVKIRVAEQVLQSCTDDTVRERAWQTIDEGIDILAELIIEKEKEGRVEPIIKKCEKFVPRGGNIEGEKWIDKK